MSFSQKFMSGKESQPAHESIADEMMGDGCCDSDRDRSTERVLELLGQVLNTKFPKGHDRLIDAVEEMGGVAIERLQREMGDVCQLVMDAVVKLQLEKARCEAKAARKTKKRAARKQRQEDAKAKVSELTRLVEDVLTMPDKELMGKEDELTKGIYRLYGDVMELLTGKGIKASYYDKSMSKVGPEMDDALCRLCVSKQQAAEGTDGALVICAFGGIENLQDLRCCVLNFAIKTARQDAVVQAGAEAANRVEGGSGDTVVEGPEAPAKPEAEKQPAAEQVRRPIEEINAGRAPEGAIPDEDALPTSVVDRVAEAAGKVGNPVVPDSGDDKPETEAERIARMGREELGEGSEQEIADAKEKLAAQASTKVTETKVVEPTESVITEPPVEDDKPGAPDDSSAADNAGDGEGENADGQGDDEPEEGGDTGEEENLKIDKPE